MGRPNFINKFVGGINENYLWVNDSEIISKQHPSEYSYGK